MDLEIVNKLYLELSQIATAKTERERELEQDLAYWVQLAKEQLAVSANIRLGSNEIIPMPRLSGIERSESLIGRKVAHPSGKDG